jgi:hypothetical protein
MNTHPICCLALLGAMGCSASVSDNSPPKPGLTYSVVIQNTFSASELADVEAGIAMWETAVPELHLTVSLSDVCPSAPHTVCVGNNQTVSSTVLGYTVRDQSNDSAKTTLYPVEQQFDHTELQTTACHELGHALGLLHTQVWEPSIDNATTPTLMYWNYQGQSHSITKTDLQQFWSMR